MWVCLCVSLFVLYRNPNGWTDRDKIWHGGGPQGVEGSWGGVRPGTPPPRYGVRKGVRSAAGASTVCFGENFIKQKLQGTPDLVGAGHLFGPQIQIWKDLGPLSFWSHGHSL